mgnify:CR=1 FL=1
MRNKFDEQLKTLNDELTQMGFLVEKAIKNAVNALETGNDSLAEDAISFDKEIDKKEKDIESLCLRLLLQQQPVARDLRQISAALKMITDMERIGDMASDIAEIEKSYDQKDMKYVKELYHIPQMADAAIDMVNRSVEAYVKKDEQLAFKVIDSDDLVDNLFTSVKNDLIELIRKDPKSGDSSMDLLMVAKYFERIGDHATNIAEWVLFSLNVNFKK